MVYVKFEFKDKIKEGLSEFELNEFFEKALIKNGAKCTSFKTILSIDDNSSIIHYTANSKDKILNFIYGSYGDFEKSFQPLDGQQRLTTLLQQI